MTDNVRSTPLAGTGSGTSIAVTKPTGVVDGDTIVIELSCSNGAGQGITPPAKFTQIPNTLVTVGTSLRMALFYKKVYDAASEPPNYTFTLAVSAASISWASLAHYGVDLITTTDGGLGASATGASTTPNHLGANIVTATDGDFCGWFTVLLTAGAGALTGPAGWNQQYINANASGGWWTTTKAAAGTLGTPEGTSNNLTWLTAMYALRPTPVTATPGSLADGNVIAGRSPYNWDDKTFEWVSNNSGAWIELEWTGTEIAVGVDTQALGNASVAAGDYPRIEYIVDDGPPSTYLLVANDTRRTLASGLASALHRLQLHYMNSNGAGANRWTQVQALRVTDFTKVDGSALASTTAYPDLGDRNVLAFGGSDVEGTETVGSGSAATLSTSKARQGFAFHVAEALGHNGLPAKIGVVGFNGQPLVQGFGNGAGVVPGGYAVSPNEDANSANALYGSGRSRLVGGLFVPAPYAVIAIYGGNDVRLAVDDTTFQTQMLAYLQWLRAKAPTAIILVPIPWGRWKATQITNAFTSWGDGNAYLLDAGAEMGNGMNDLADAGTGVPSWRSNDSLHPNPAASGELAARYMGDYQRQVAAKGGGNRGVASVRVGI